MPRLHRCLSKAQPQLGHGGETVPLRRTHKRAAAAAAAKSLPAALHRLIPGQAAGACRWRGGRCQRRLPIHGVLCLGRTLAAAAAALRLIAAAVVVVGCAAVGGRLGPLRQAAVWVACMLLQYGSHGGGMVGAAFAKGQAWRESEKKERGDKAAGQ
jgi:hypothetical protein